MLLTRGYIIYSSISFPGTRMDLRLKSITGDKYTKTRSLVRVTIRPIFARLGRLVWYRRLGSCLEPPFLYSILSPSLPRHHRRILERILFLLIVCIVFWPTHRVVPFPIIWDPCNPHPRPDYGSISFERPDTEIRNFMFLQILD